MEFDGVLSTLGLTSLIEKSSRLLTAGWEDARLGVPFRSFSGEDDGPIEVWRRAGEFREVLIGERERGGGSNVLEVRLRRCSVRASVGSGIVPNMRRACQPRYDK